MALKITEICVHCDEMNSVCECYTDDMTLYECIKCDKEYRSTEMMFNKNGLNPFCGDCYDGEYDEEGGKKGSIKKHMGFYKKLKSILNPIKDASNDEPKMETIEMKDCSGCDMPVNDARPLTCEEEGCDNIFCDDCAPEKCDDCDGTFCDDCEHLVECDDCLRLHCPEVEWEDCAEEEEDDDAEWAECYGVKTTKTKVYIMAGGGDHWWNYVVDFDDEHGEQLIVYKQDKSGMTEQYEKRLAYRHKNNLEELRLVPLDWQPAEDKDEGLLTY